MPTKRFDVEPVLPNRQDFVLLAYHLSRQPEKSRDKECDRIYNQLPFTTSVYEAIGKPVDFEDMDKLLSGRSTPSDELSLKRSLQKLYIKFYEKIAGKKITNQNQGVSDAESERVPMQEVSEASSYSDN